MALILHLYEGGIKITNKTITHFCGYYLTPTEALKLLLPLHVFGYIEITKGVDGAYISMIREDNEIKE